MAENENPAPAPEQAAPTPEVASPSGEQTPASMNLDSKITFEGKEVSVGDLIKENQKIADLETYNANARVLMAGESAPVQDRENAMRYLLSKEGYTSDQIEAHIKTARDMMDPQETPQNQAAPEPQAPPQEDPRIKQMQEQQNRMNVDMLRRDLDNAVQNVMGSNQKIQTLIEKSKQLAGEEGLDARIASIRDEVQRATMDNLRSRKSRGERFDNSWFNQETNRAADAVYERIRSVIGDPDKIQRAPETASSADSFVNKPPVAEPTFEPGDNMGSAQNKSHDWTVDTLSRLANDVSQGGESRL